MNRVALLSLGQAVITVAIVVALAPSCTTHGEGGRCDPNNGNADCDNGLICINGDDIILPEGGYSQAAICCPTDRSDLMPGDICYLNSMTPGSEAGIPEGGFPEASMMDVPVDQTSSDVTQSDVSTDAPADASDAAGD